MTVVRRRAKSAPPPPDTAATKDQQELDLAAITDIFKRQREAKNEATRQTQLAEKLKTDELLPALVEFGVAHGEKGQHLAIKLPEVVDGKSTLVRRTVVSRGVDMDKVQATLTDKGIVDRCSTLSIAVRGLDPSQLDAVKKLLTRFDRMGGESVVVQQIDQDKMMAYHQTHRDKETAPEGEPVLTAAEVDSFFVETESFQFHPE